ncbi:MAG: hypothetical protein J2P21_12450 [Chloracidobacterium sp.]|nr:hypothetical protein [Chloracidobacterium sp.]
MTKSQRILAIILGAAMLISGFAFGRMAETPKSTAEERAAAALVTSPSPLSSPSPESLPSATPEVSTTASGAASENQAFYLSDFKTGYTDGYNAGADGQSSSVTSSTRAGYNDGFKDGFADGFQARVKSVTAGPVTRAARQEVVYRSSGAPVRRGGNSKLKTVLTIAAPAAIGAGIGAAAGGGRGAAAGALIGGGGGALYHLFKNRNRN